MTGRVERFFHTCVQMSPCGGKDAWRRTQGCGDSRTAVRLTGGDLPCNATPGIYSAGFCDCDDGIPRHFGCGKAKRTCQEVCAEPPPPSTLAAAFPDASSPAAPATSSTTDTPPWWRAHTPAIVVSVAVLVALLLHHFTAPAVNEGRRFARLLRDQRSEIEFERTLSM